ncbi:hypothetical protein LTR95_005977, partial [Oleoguttula sp. CCFEE 5521]
MPGSAKKLHIVAAADGILVHPVSSKGKPEGSLGVRLKYGSLEVASFQQNAEHEASEVRIEAHGILGLLDLGSAKFLICITRREEVAQIRGRPIYTITDVTLVPLASNEEAVKTVQAAAQALKQGNAAVHEDSDHEESEEGDAASINEESPAETGAALEAPEQASEASKEPTSFLKNVVQNKGKYGKFAGKWFSRAPPAAKPAQEPAVQEVAEKETPKGDALATTESTEADDAATEETSKSGTGSDKNATTQTSNVETLTPRILRSAKLFFGSRSFYFSYDYDLSSSLAQESPSSTSLPLHKRFDTNFFWNRNLVKPFIDSSQDFAILPVIQGFVGQRAFSIGMTEEGEKDAIVGASEQPKEAVAAQGEPAKATNQSDLLITIISRRSVKRA